MNTIAKPKNTVKEYPLAYLMYCMWVKEKVNIKVPISAPVLDAVISTPTLYAKGKANIPESNAGRRNANSFSPNMPIAIFDNKINEVL